VQGAATVATIVKANASLDGMFICAAPEIVTNRRHHSFVAETDIASAFLRSAY
jgi:hypothetical protein